MVYCEGSSRAEAAHPGGLDVDIGERRDPATDAIDDFAEALSRHPEQADDLKAALRKKMGLPPEAPAPTPGTRPEMDPEDLWDNVPI